jgi:hypothetical protein
MLWLSYEDCTALPRRVFHRIFLADKDFIGKDTRFRVQGDGTSVLPNGRLSGFRIVRASDCVEVSIQGEDEGSPLQAENEMKERIQGAFQIMERAPIVDPHGELMGERAILLIRLGQKEPRVEIIAQRKDDRKLFVIGSVSLAHALAFEKLIQNGYRTDSDGYVIASGR